MDEDDPRQVISDDWEQCCLLTAELLYRRQIWRRFRDIARDGFETEKSREFIRFVANTYFESQAVGLRRLLERGRKDTLNIVRILRRVESGEIPIRRATFLRAVGSGGHESQATRMWRELGGNDSLLLPASVVADDLASLQERLDPIKKYVDRRIAHNDRQDPGPMPPVQQLDELLDRLLELERKWNLLLCDSDLWNHEVFSADFWAEGFKQPWIVDPEVHTGLCVAIEPSSQLCVGWTPYIQSLVQRDRIHNTRDPIAGSTKPR